MSAYAYGTVQTDKVFTDIVKCFLLTGYLIYITKHEVFLPAHESTVSTSEHHKYTSVIRETGHSRELKVSLLVYLVSVSRNLHISESF